MRCVLADLLVDTIQWAFHVTARCCYVANGGSTTTTTSTTIQNSQLSSSTRFLEFHNGVVVVDVVDDVRDSDA